MGCSSSKDAKSIRSPASIGTTTAGNGRSGNNGNGSGRGGINKQPSLDNDEGLLHSKIHPNKPERLYKLLAKALQPGLVLSSQSSIEQRRVLYQKILEHCQQEPTAARWTNPTTGSTPLHLACRLVDVDTTTTATTTSTTSTASENNGNLNAKMNSSLFPELMKIVDTLIASHAGALRQVDAAQNIPLHYAIAPSTHFNPYGSSSSSNNSGGGAVGAGGGNRNSSIEEGPPGTTEQDQDDKADAELSSSSSCKYNWKQRALLVQHLMDADRQVSQHYLEQNDVIFESGDATGGCTPLYRALQTIPDDFDTVLSPPTVDYISILHNAYPYNAGKGNASDGDKPLSLLYRRFTRQFDISEQFFAGDNSRPQVVQHRQRYKTAAGNSWKLIELLLKPTNLASPTSPWGIVHCAVQVETPPDLLRYIVETNAQDLTRVDPQGNLPLHYAAASKPPPGSSPRRTTTSTTTTRGGGGGGGGGTRSISSDHYPAFYTKYVMDELLYKFPEAAGMADAQGNFPLTLAVTSGKQWIGGGIKSLHDAYPDALQQLKLDEHPTLIRALSMAENNNNNSEAGEGGEGASTPGSSNYSSAGSSSFDVEQQETNDEDDDGKEDSKDELSPTAAKKKKPQKKKLLRRGVVKDEQYDAIMLVQQPNVTVEEVTTSMWAHEEDAGVQMLGCVAISNMLRHQPPVEVLRIALTGTASVVNAMKAHPNELIVQEKACAALQGLASADGHREVSMVASGAVAAIVGAMQAHVGDAGVQEQACLAVAAIVRHGGADRATVVASVSGVTAILNALAAHAQVVGVQVAGLQALEAMTQYPNANLPELPRAQTEPLLMSAQETFPKECTTLATELMGRMST